MASSGYVASALVMGFALVALAVALGRARNWRRYVPPRDADSESASGDAAFEFLRTTAANPTVWVVAFLVASLGIGAGAILFVSGEAVPAPLRRIAWLAVVCLSLALVAGYVFWGTYQSSRYRGLDSAQATLTALWVWGLLFVVAVVLKLVMA